MRIGRNSQGVGSADRRPFVSPPMLIDPDLVSKSYHCEHCGAWNAVNWFKQQGAPKESVKSDIKGFWVPISFTNICAVCEGENCIAAPESPDARGLYLFADESDRHFELNGKKYYYFCLAGVGISPTHIRSIQASVDKIEQTLSEASNGRVTALHAKDVMDAKNWSPSFTPQFRANFLLRACKLVETKFVTKFVVCGCVEWTKSDEQHYLRDQVFSAYYLYSLSRIRKSGFVPLYHFDQVRSGKKNGWAEECVRGIRCYPQFVWYSQRAHIPEEVFIKPGSCVQSKLADVLAFVTAREFARCRSGQKTEIPTKAFGSTFFAGFNGKSDLIFRTQKGFPLVHVFGFEPIR